jgi:hypothetical protein
MSHPNKPQTNEKATILTRSVPLHINDNVTKKPHSPNSSDNPDYSPKASAAFLAIRSATTSYDNIVSFTDAGDNRKRLN